MELATWNAKINKLESLSYELYKSEQKVLQIFLQKALADNDEYNAKHIFTRLGYQVPVEAFTWVTQGKEPDYFLLDLLFHRQQLCDNFINDMMNSCKDDDELSVSEVIAKLSATNHTFSGKDIYFVQELLTNGSVLSYKKYPVANIRKNYKCLQTCVDEIVLETSYYAQPSILEKVVQLLKVYKICYRYQPFVPGRHKAVYEWLENNIKRESRGLAVGWRCGPDSGKWPSEDINDYKKVLCILQLLM